MRVLTPVIEVATLAMFDPRQNLALRGAVALQFIRNYHPGDILAAFEQLAEELFRGLFVTPTLHQDIEDVVVLIHRTPQVMALPVDGQKDFIQVPFVPRLRAPAP